MNIQQIRNVSDCVPLYLPHSLYLKPIAKFNISVALPTTKITGKTISNWDVMEKLRQIILPNQYSVLKVTKSTLDNIRFEAEIEDRSKLKSVLSLLDGHPIKLAGFVETLKIRAAETKDDYPTRHDWDSFFRDAHDMDEMKCGERPDTIHIANLPIRWFCPRHLQNDDTVKPSENIFKRIFEKFGTIKAVDIPICDPYRKDMKPHMTGMKTFSFDQELYFEGYVQFNDYSGFVKTMDEFRGVKLIHKEVDQNLSVGIKVDFDKTKHLSEVSIKRRKIVRDRLIAKEKTKAEDERKRLKMEEEKQAQERLRQEELKQIEQDKQREREEKRKEKNLKKLREKDQHEIDGKIRLEEKRLLVVQRRLESIRLLDSLFERIKLKKMEILKKNIKNDKLERNSNEVNKRNTNNEFNSIKSNDLRNKLMKRFKNSQEIEFEKHKHRLNKVKSGSTILGVALNDRSASINSISSDDSLLNEKEIKKIKKAKKKKRRNSSTSSMSSSLSSSASSSKSKGSPSTETGKKMQNINALVPMQSHPVPYPMYNPMAGPWMGMGMYPVPTPPYYDTNAIRPSPFYDTNAIRPASYFPVPGPWMGMGIPMQQPFRGYRGNRPYFRGRGRGMQMVTFNDRNYNDNELNNHGYNGPKYTSNSRSRSRSRRSRTRSRSRSHSRSRSYSRSRNRRSRSSRSSRSSSRSRRSRSTSKSKNKLVSTLRSRSVSRSPSWSSARSKSKHKRSWSRSPSAEQNTKSAHISPTRNKPENEVQQHIVHLQPDKLMRAAKEIQRSVQQKLQERALQEEKRKSNSRDSQSEDNIARLNDNYDKNSKSRSRSKSVDSSKFMSPKRQQQNSSTHEKQWDD